MRRHVLRRHVMRMICGILLRHGLLLELRELTQLRSRWNHPHLPCLLLPHLPLPLLLLPAL